MTENTYKAGDRVLCSDGYGHTDVPGTVLKQDEDAFLVKLDVPTDRCYFENSTARYFFPAEGGLKLAPKAPTASVKVPAAPKAGTRIAQVLRHLTSGKSLTQGEAIILGYGTRLAAHIHDLRGKGHTIVTSMKEDLNGFPYAEYRLVTRRANGNRKAA